MNERIKELAEQAGMHYREMSDEFCAADTDGVPLAMMTIFAELVRLDETKACAKHYLEIMRIAIDSARKGEREACAKLCDELARMVGNENFIAIDQRQFCAKESE